MEVEQASEDNFVIMKMQMMQKELVDILLPSARAPSNVLFNELGEIWQEINVKCYWFASTHRSSVSAGNSFTHPLPFPPFRLRRDPRILELLYEEARHNVLLGRYIMEPAHSIMLGGIQARIELGPYNVHTHTVSYFRWGHLGQPEKYKKF
jgi:FERM central domain